MGFAGKKWYGWVNWSGYPLDCNYCKSTCSANIFRLPTWFKGESKIQLLCYRAREGVTGVSSRSHNVVSLSFPSILVLTLRPGAPGISTHISRQSSHEWCYRNIINIGKITLNNDHLLKLVILEKRSTLTNGMTSFYKITILLSDKKSGGWKSDGWFCNGLVT